MERHKFREGEWDGKGGELFKDINGVQLHIGQFVIVAGKDPHGANVPVLKKATITDMYTEYYGDKLYPYVPTVCLTYYKSGVKNKISGYADIFNERICVTEDVAPF